MWGGPSSNLSRLYLAALRASPLNPSPHSIFALQIAEDSTPCKFMIKSSRFVTIRCLRYRPSVRSGWLDCGQVLFCVFIDRDELEVNKNEANTKPSWQYTLVNKGFIICPKLFLRDQRGKSQNGPILPACVANQNAGFASSCPLADSAI